MGKIQANQKKKMDLRDSPRGERSENIGGGSKYITIYSREAARQAAEARRTQCRAVGSFLERGEAG